MEQRESPAGTETKLTGRREAHGQLSLVARAVAWLTVILYAVGAGTTYQLERAAGLREGNSMEDMVILTGFGALLVAKRSSNVVGWIGVARETMQPAHIPVWLPGPAYHKGRERDD